MFNRPRRAVCCEISSPNNVGLTATRASIWDESPIAAASAQYSATARSASEGSVTASPNSENIALAPGMPSDS